MTASTHAPRQKCPKRSALSVLFRQPSNQPQCQSCVEPVWYCALLDELRYLALTENYNLLCCAVRLCAKPGGEELLPSAQLPQAGRLRLRHPGLTVRLCNSSHCRRSFFRAGASFGGCQRSKFPGHPRENSRRQPPKLELRPAQGNHRSRARLSERACRGRQAHFLKPFLGAG